MRSLSRPVSRRSVQGLLAGALVVPLTGCDPLSSASRSPRSEPAAPTADESLATRVAGALRDARDAAAASPQGAPLVAAHTAHLAALGVAPDAASPSPSSAAVDLRATEVALQATLTDAARAAADGGLARLLASMAASVAQHLAVLAGQRERGHRR